MADNSGGRTVGFILCLALSAFFLLFALLTAVTAASAADKVYDDKSPDTSPASCAHPPQSNSQDYWDCIFTNQEANGGEVAEYNAKVTARRASAEAAGNRAVALAVVGLTLGVFALAFNVSSASGRATTDPRRVHSHAVPPPAAPVPPAADPQQGIRQGMWQGGPQARGPQ